MLFTAPSEQRSSAPDAAPEGASEDTDGGSAALDSGSPLRVTRITEADGFFTRDNGENHPFGHRDMANVGGQYLQSTALFRFDLRQLPALRSLSSARVVLDRVTSSMGCGTDTDTCQSCLGFFAGGEFYLFFARSDWDEATFTGHCRRVPQGSCKDEDEWAAPFAEEVGTDRSAAVAATSYDTGAAKLEFTLSEEELETMEAWVENEKITLLIEPKLGKDVGFIAGTRESLECDGYRPEPAQFVFSGSQ